jgi:hypothetical protein
MALRAWEEAILWGLAVLVPIVLVLVLMYCWMRKLVTKNVRRQLEASEVHESHPNPNGVSGEGSNAVSHTPGTTWSFGGRGNDSSVGVSDGRGVFGAAGVAALSPVEGTALQPGQPMLAKNYIFPSTLTPRFHQNAYVQQPRAPVCSSPSLVEVSFICATIGVCYCDTTVRDRLFDGVAPMKACAVLCD